LMRNSYKRTDSDLLCTVAKRTLSSHKKRKTMKRTLKTKD